RLGSFTENKVRLLAGVYSTCEDCRSSESETTSGERCSRSSCLRVREDDGHQRWIYKVFGLSSYCLSVNDGIIIGMEQLAQFLMGCFRVITSWRLQSRRGGQFLSQWDRNNAVGGT
ncbi:hypothetical protein LINPERHAP2_LOCUS37781, partial [Linum perenne]